MKYKHHPSVLKMKEVTGENISKFCFSETTIEKIENEIKQLNVCKNGTFKNILPQCLLETLYVSGPKLRVFY